MKFLLIALLLSPIHLAQAAPPRIAGAERYPCKQIQQVVDNAGLVLVESNRPWRNEVFIYRDGCQEPFASNQGYWVIARDSLFCFVGYICSFKE